MASNVQINLTTTAAGNGAQQTTTGLNNVAQAAQHAAAAQGQVTGGSRNMGNALLQGSRALQDMQYGLAGAVNNLEGIASALGLGAGVAGVVTVLAVAVQTLGPKVVEMLKSFDGATQVKAELEAMQKQLGDVEPVHAATVAGERYKQQLDAEAQALKAANDQIDNQLKLLALQSAAKKSQAAFELEQGIQDIQAQGLPREQEAAEIAARRTQFAEEEKRRADEEAAGREAAAIEKARLAEQERVAAEAELAVIKQRIYNAGRFKDLLDEEVRLKLELEAARKAAYDIELGDIDTPQQERLRREIEANAAEQAALQIRGLGTPESNETQRAQAEARKQEAAKAAEAARAASNQALAEEQARRTEREAELERERQRIARERAPGVLGPNLVTPGNPLGVQPLPSGAGPATLPGSPFGPAPLPGAGAFIAPPPAPLGGAALPQLDRATDATQAATRSNDAGNDAVLKFAETTTAEMERLRKSNTDLQTKITQLESRMKNSRVA